MDDFDEVFCICGQPWDPSETEDMAQCESCFNWFHPACVEAAAAAADCDSATDTTGDQASDKVRSTATTAATPFHCPHCKKLTPPSSPAEPDWPSCHEKVAASASASGLTIPSRPRSKSCGSVHGRRPALSKPTARKPSHIKKEREKEKERALFQAIGLVCDDSGLGSRALSVERDAADITADHMRGLALSPSAAMSHSLSIDVKPGSLQHCVTPNSLESLPFSPAAGQSRRKKSTTKTQNLRKASTHSVQSQPSQSQSLPIASGALSPSCESTSSRGSSKSRRSDGDSKRLFHNERERNRRSTIRNLFERLRHSVPEGAQHDGMSDRQILIEGAKCIENLKLAFQELESQKKEMLFENLMLKLQRSDEELEQFGGRELVEKQLAELMLPDEADAAGSQPAQSADAGFLLRAAATELQM
eukprot:m.228845 g.228845  ORF g.228845 m.228845 type:complete len:419 (+) comp15196_c1_seq1:100-1356(+)